MASRPPRRLAAWVLAALATAIAALIIYLAISFPEALEDRGSKIGLTHQILWLLLLLSSFAVRWRTSPGEALRNLAIRVWRPC